MVVIGFNRVKNSQGSRDFILGYKFLRVRNYGRHGAMESIRSTI
jgi:hypothetical protein